MRAALRIPAMMLWLTVLWVALWGSVSWANVLGGIVVAGAVVLFARLDSAEFQATYFRPVWAIAYLAVLAWQLLTSNLRIAFEILRPGDRTHTAVVAVPIRGGSDAIVNLVANSITLTPGTITIQSTRHRPHEPDLETDLSARVTLYVHSLFAHDVETIRHDVLKLEALALHAFGSPADYARARQDVVDHEPLLRSGHDRGTSK